MTALVSRTGTVQPQYRYSAYGNVTVMAADWSDTTDSYDWAYTYGAYYQHVADSSDTGFYQCRFRYYSSELGRWLTRDPIGEEGGKNLYGYAGFDPINSVDYTGLLQEGKCASDVMERAGRAVSRPAARVVVTEGSKAIGKTIAIRGAAALGTAGAVAVSGYGYYQIGDQIIGPALADALYESQVYNQQIDVDSLPQTAQERIGKRSKALRELYEKDPDEFDEKSQCCPWRHAFLKAIKEHFCGSGKMDNTGLPPLRPEGPMSQAI